MSKTFRRIAVLVLFLALIALAGAACAEPMKFASRSEAIKYIQKNQPTELTLEGVKMKPSDLLAIKQALPEGAEFHFTTKWGSVKFSDDVEDLDLREKKNTVTIKELEAIIAICPNVKHIDNSKCTSLSNKQMIPMLEKYPDIQFEWVVNLGMGYHLSTRATAYSTFKHISSTKWLESKDLENLKYCPRLKALDLGHHKIKDLEWLKYVPDLELLIIGQNRVSDISPMGQLKHLQYAELFLNSFSDISCLANCTELLDLNLTATNVDDLTALDNITTLERLWINSCTKLSQEQVDHFKELHPNCVVDFKPKHGAKQDGWRDNPRYKHYLWCLKNRKWIPFNEEIPKS